LILLLVVLACAIACIIVVVFAAAGSNGDVAVVDTNNVIITLTVITNDFLFVDIFWLYMKTNLYKRFLLSSANNEKRRELKTLYEIMPKLDN
jgi:parvulin-like peptidyl-prolyl isomerase